MHSSKHILITGGAGFIGSHTVDLLLQKNYKVSVFDNLSTGKLSNLNMASPALRFIKGDVMDYAALLSEIQNCDAVIHLAALPSVPQSIAQPITSHAINMVGFLHVLQAIRETQKPIRLIYASSAAIYGDAASLPCGDDMEIKHAALSPYALEKTQNEQYADLYARLFNIPSLALRYFNVYGDRQDPLSVYSGVITRFLNDYKQHKKITIFGDGKQSRDFIHVADVARANGLALESDYTGVLNIATGIPETLNNLASYIEETGGKKAQVEWAASRLGDIRASYACTKKAEEYLHFRHQLSLREGIKQLMVRWMSAKVN